MWKQLETALRGPKATVAADFCEFEGRGGGRGGGGGGETYI